MGGLAGMAETYSDDLVYGVNQEAAKKYWLNPTWCIDSVSFEGCGLVVRSEIVHVLIHLILDEWNALTLPGNQSERRKIAEKLALSARWRAVRHLNRNYKRKVIPDASERD